jgi:hypothetical protein
MEWKDIKGFEGFYKISSNGIVFSIRRGLFLKPGFSHAGRKGYLTVNLAGLNGVATARVHRLVAEHFLGDPPEAHEVNHKNGIKTDNRVGNLEWVTRGVNIRHSVHVTKTFPVGSKNPNSVLNESQVVQIRELRIAGKKMAELSRMFNVSQITISKIIARKRWKSVA